MSLKDEAQFAKRHIRNRFSLMVLPHVSDGIWSVYENAKTICEKNDQMDQVLKTFQNLLTRIPVWTDEVLQTEVKRIVAASKCSYLDELLTGVLLSYLRAFAAIQYRSTQDSVEVEFERPPLPRFIHEYYKEVARRSWEHAYLFRTIGVPTEQQARNRKQIDEILDAAFDTVLDSFLPWQSIVNTYFSVQDAPPPSADVIQPTKTEVDPPSAPAPEPEKKVAFEHEHDEDSEDLDEETDDEHPRIHLSDETLELDLGAVDEDEKKPEKKKEEEEDNGEVNLTPEEGEGLVLKV
jgi:hypothetical protein